MQRILSKLLLELTTKSQSTRTISLILISFFLLTTTYAQQSFESNKIIQLKSQLNTAKNISKVTLLNSICDEYENLAIDSSLNYAKKALLLSEKISYSDGVIRSSNNIGSYYSEKGDFEKAFNYFNKALTLAKSTGSKKLEAHCLNFIGRVHLVLTDYPTTIEKYLQSITIREQIKDSLGLGMMNGNLGHVYREINDLNNAEKHLLKALEINTTLKDTGYSIVNYINLGILYHNMDDLDKAMEFHQKGLDYSKAFGDIEGEAIILGNISNVISEKGNFEKAIEYLNKSLKIKEKFIKKPRSITHAYAKFQQINLEHGKYQASIDYGNKTMKLLNQYTNKNLEKKVLIRLSEAYGKLQKNKEAYTYSQQYIALNDSIFNEKKSHQVKQLQTIYETNKKDLTIIEQENKIQFIEASSLFKTRLTWAVGIGTLLFFGSIYLYRSRQFALKAKNLQGHYSRQLLASHEEERKRISRDLHDSVGQSLMLIKNKVALNKDNTTASMVTKALEEVRTISKALHPAVLDKLGLTASIKKLIADADKYTDIFFSEEIDPIDDIFSKEHELQIYRITQEAINNIIKHSKTESASIHVINETSKVIIKIKDYGVGFDIVENSNAFNSLGMRTLKERTRLIGGKILIDSTKGKGTNVLLVNNKPS